MKNLWGLLLLSFAIGSVAIAGQSALAAADKPVTFSTYLNDNYRILAKRKKPIHQVAFQDPPERYLASDPGSANSNSGSNNSSNGNGTGNNNKDNKNSNSASGWQNGNSLWKNGDSSFPTDNSNNFVPMVMMKKDGASGSESAASDGSASPSSPAPTNGSSAP